MSTLMNWSLQAGWEISLLIFSITQVLNLPHALILGYSWYGPVSPYSIFEIGYRLSAVTLPDIWCTYRSSLWDLLLPLISELRKSHLQLCILSFSAVGFALGKQFLLREIMS